MINIIAKISNEAIIGNKISFHITCITYFNNEPKGGVDLIVKHGKSSKKIKTDDNGFDSRNLIFNIDGNTVEVIDATDSKNFETVLLSKVITQPTKDSNAKKEGEDFGEEEYAQKFLKNMTGIFDDLKKEISELKLQQKPTIINEPKLSIEINDKVAPKENLPIKVKEDKKWGEVSEDYKIEITKRFWDNLNRSYNLLVRGNSFGLSVPNTDKKNWLTVLGLPEYFNYKTYYDKLSQKHLIIKNSDVFNDRLLIDYIDDFNVTELTIDGIKPNNPFLKDKAGIDFSNIKKLTYNASGSEYSTQIGLLSLYYGNMTYYSYAIGILYETKIRKINLSNIPIYGHSLPNFKYLEELTIKDCTFHYGQEIVLSSFSSNNPKCNLVVK